MIEVVDGFGRALLSWVGATSLWAVAVLAVVLLIDRLGRRFISPGARMVLYAAVFARVALPVDFASPLGLGPAQEHAALVLPEVTAAVSSVPAAAVAAEPVATGWPWGMLVAIAYALGVVGIAAGLIVMQVRLHRSLRAGRRRSVAGAADVLEHETAGPFAVVGKVVIPRRMFEVLEPGELRAVVRHEQAHLRHGDPWLAGVLAGICALLWPVLPVWVAAWRVRFLMELRADRAAVAGLDGAGRKAYRKLMLRIAAMRWQAPVVSPAFGPVAALEARLAALGSPGWGPVWVQGAGTVAVGAVMLCCAGHSEPEEAQAQAQTQAQADAPARSCPIPIFGEENEPADHAQVEHSKRLRGQLQEAGDDLAAVQRVLGEAQAANLRRVQAEARFVAGQMLGAAGNYAEAETMLEEGAWLGASTQHDGIAAAASGELVSLGLASGKAEDALAWHRHHEAAMKRLGDVPLPNEARMLRLLIKHFEAEPARVRELQARLEVVEAACGG